MFAVPAAFAQSCGENEARDPETRQCVSCIAADGNGVFNGQCYPQTVVTQLEDMLRNCEERGWRFSFSLLSCVFAARDPDGGTYNSRVLNAATTVAANSCIHGVRSSSASSPVCADAFGPDFAFPATLHSGRPEIFVYNCDPDGTRGLVPTTHNLNRETNCECADADAPRVGAEDGVFPLQGGAATVTVSLGGRCVSCPDGQAVFNGQCYPQTVATQLEDMLRNCEERGWRFSFSLLSCLFTARDPDGGTYNSRVLNAATTVAANSCIHGVRSSSASSPVCADAFGPNFAFPATLHPGRPEIFVYNCDPDETRGLVPTTHNLNRDGNCECADAAAIRVGATDSAFPLQGGAATVTASIGGHCVGRDTDLSLVAEELLCGGFGGTLQIATGGQVCSGMDAADTFCIVDSGAANGHAFACRGLFKHVRDCNLKFHRPALNPFLCAPRCADDEAPSGGACES